MEKRGIQRYWHWVIVMGILPLAGCLVYHNDVRYGEKGKAPTENTLDQIQAGRTTKDWLLATLGEPSRQSTGKEGQEVLEYEYSRKKDNSFVLVPFVFINDEGENRQTLYFEIEDGVVTNYWKETSQR
jgi:outer membrane protein assembly factor BamE (lipoprotein component of BamABCDE complex)